MRPDGRLAWCTSNRGRITSQHDYALFAVLLFAGTLGLTEQIHKLTADLGQLAGSVVALCGLVRLGTLSPGHETIEPRAALIAGMTVGTGVGLAFMSKGLLVPGLVTLTWLGCLALPSYRSSAAKTAAWMALAAALPWLLIWPVLLYAASPDLLNEWFWTNNVGRLLGQGDLGGTGVSLWDKTLALTLAAFPIWPLCVTVIARTWRAKESNGWSIRARALSRACVAMFLTASLLAMGGSGSFRDNYLLPLLPALVLLGLPAIAITSGRLDPLLKRSTDIFFALAAAIPFLVWVQLAIVGTLWPATLRVGLAKILPLPFDLVVSQPSFVVAVSSVLLWQYARRRPQFRGATASWCLGIAMLWVVSFSLLLPWIDAARSYQAVFTDLRTQLVRPNCLATSNLGESQLAMLEYITGIEAIRLHQGGRAAAIAPGLTPPRPSVTGS